MNCFPHAIPFKRGRVRHWTVSAVVSTSWRLVPTLLIRQRAAASTEAPVAKSRYYWDTLGNYSSIE